MKIAVVGAGFTGLAAAFQLSQKGQEVIVFEKEKELGGMASAFKLPGWQFPLEKHYHHFFANDFFAFRFFKILNLEKKLVFKRALTSVYFQGKIYPFDSPSHLLKFSPLPFSSRLQTGAALAFLKFLPFFLAEKLEKYEAYAKTKFLFGKKSFEILWQPLFWGKFGRLAKKVNFSWFWARLKKRTPKLGFLLGSNEVLAQALMEKIKKNGGKIIFQTSFSSRLSSQFEKILVTTPTKNFLSIFPKLPEKYKKKLRCLPHLYSLTLILISPQKILPQTYWLNINEKGFPFVGLIQHTNVLSPSLYGQNHLLYFANYLPSSHPFLKLSKEELFSLYLPFLKKINPKVKLPPKKYQLELFRGEEAQPVFPKNYSQIKPSFATPFPSVYLANLDMVYPWDRGVNYALELGVKAADFLLKHSS